MGTNNLDFLKISAGTLDIDTENKSHLVLTVGTRDIKVFNVLGEDLEYLDNILESAYFSQDNRKVTNTEVRKSKHTKTFKINIQFEDILNKLFLRNCTLQPYKLNYYSKGDFFQNHKDTDRPYLMGTLVVILPVHHIGGELRFGDYHPESGLDKETIRFIYFDGNLEHAIDKVQEGHRITLIYNVYSQGFDDSVIPIVTLLKIPEQQYQKLLETALEFCNNKNNVLFGNCKYRNDVFYDLVQDLKSRYEVIKVSVENDGSPITEVHVVDFECDSDTEFMSYGNYVQDNYSVEHVLFTEDYSLESESVYLTRHYGYRGNSPFSETYSMTHYIAYLVNPLKKLS